MLFNFSKSQLVSVIARRTFFPTTAKRACGKQSPKGELSPRNRDCFASFNFATLRSGRSHIVPMLFRE